MPSEQPREGTRVCEHAHEGNICPICEPAQPQPRGEEARVGGRIQEGALSAVRTPTNPPVESRLVPLAPPRGEGDDLAARLEDLASWLEPDSPFHGTIREAAQLARASTHPEQSERIVGAALDLLDSLGAPHYHDLIGMTYTLRKEQADNLRRALEPASPTPTEQGEDA